MNIDTALIVRFLLAALAVYRVAWFAKEDGPFGVFVGMRSRLGKLAAREKYQSGFELHGIAWTLAEISNCPHCFGVWLAMLAAPAVFYPCIYSDIILVILALAGLQSFLTRATSEE